jgi:hypothetical protein
MVCTIQVLRFNGQTGPLKMGPVGRLETSIANYKSMRVTPQKCKGLKYIATEP